jgi:toxin ParE1/3/4
MKVVVTEAALEDLFRIARFIESDSPARAVSFIDELHDRCRRLGGMPKAYPLIPGRELSGIRRRPHGNYLIFYRITDRAVEVLHVLNGAQDYERILFPED